MKTLVTIGVAAALTTSSLFAHGDHKDDLAAGIHLRFHGLADLDERQNVSMRSSATDQAGVSNHLFSGV